LIDGVIHMELGEIVDFKFIFKNIFREEISEPEFYEYRIWNKSIISRVDDTSLSDKRVYGKHKGETNLTVKWCDKTATINVVVGCSDPFEEGCFIIYSKKVEGYDDKGQPECQCYFKYDFTLQMRVTTIDGITHGAFWLVGGLHHILECDNEYDYFESAISYPFILNDNTFNETIPHITYQSAVISGTIYSEYIDLNFKFRTRTNDAIWSYFDINVILDEPQAIFF